MITALYLVTFIITLSMTEYYLVRNPKVDNLFVCFGIALILNSGGRFLLAVSSSLDMALFSQKLIYIGNCYCPFLLIHLLTRMCGVKVPRSLTWSLFIFATTVFCLAMTIGISPIYYKSVSLAHTDGYSYLEKVYAPTHFLNTALMLVYAALILFYLIYSIKKSSTVSTRTVSVMCLLGIARRRNIYPPAYSPHQYKLSLNRLSYRLHSNGEYRRAHQHVRHVIQYCRIRRPLKGIWLYRAG